MQGIETIRQLYGEETANGMIRNNVRQRYYLLDNKDLTNEQLIDMLEHMPAYNRSSEQYAHLKELSVRGGNSQSRNIDNADGTIHF